MSFYTLLDSRIFYLFPISKSKYESLIDKSHTSSTEVILLTKVVTITFLLKKDSKKATTTNLLSIIINYFSFVVELSNYAIERSGYAQCPEGHCG